ncbi:ABC transporter ATP-binding protein [Methylosinus sporium]|uniref:ABC transporter ATP-binding protein n=1 Tax=Methylosinus sporium TaxID=428 RepID=UPI00383ADEEE
MKIKWAEALKPVTAILGDYWRQSKLTLIVVAGITTLSTLASVGAPYLFSKSLDRISAGEPVEQTLIGFVVYAGLLGIATVLRHAVDYLTFMTSENLNFIAGVSFFERILKKTTDFFIDHNSAEIQSAQSRGQSALNGFVQLALGIIVPSIAQIALTIATLGAVLSADIATIVFIYGVVFVGFTYLANKWTNQHLHAAIESTQANARFVGNAMNAMETLRHFDSQDWLRRKFSAKAREIRDRWRSFCLERVGYGAFFGVMLALQFAITFWLLLPKYRTGTVTVGDLVLFNTLLLQLNQPFEMVGHAIDNLARSYSQFMPYVKMWLAPEETDAEQGSPLEIREGRIQFRSISFSYPNGRGVEDVRFAAERGRLNFLIGKTGAGKSTIFRLLLKSLAPAKGQILIDSTDLANVGRRQWFSRIGVVPQEIVLLNDSLRTNIVLGRQPDETKLRETAARAAILGFIDALPEGFETLVGERGLKLSGGERQRIAIARALYAEPEFLFLDEASSALDEVTERGIMTEIRNIADEVTVLAITHRKVTIDADDHVIQLSEADALANQADAG